MICKHDNETQAMQKNGIHADVWTNNADTHTMHTYAERIRWNYDEWINEWL